MIEKIIIYGTISLAVSLTLNYLNNGSNHKIQSSKGKYNLKMNKLYGIVGSLAVGFALIFNITFLILNDLDESGVWILSIISLIFLGTGLPCLLYYKNHSLNFDKNEITVINVYGNKKKMKWREVVNYSFNPFTGLLKLDSEKGKSIKVHQHLIGLSKFINMMNKRTRLDIQKLKNISNNIAIVID